MARYAIGDIQGCFTEFEALLKKVRFHPDKDELFCVGDIVNRGPQSLETLRWMYAHRDCVHMVLGNHDLHLLMVAKGYTRLKRGDTLQDILAAPDKHQLLDWLQAQPLFSVFDGFCLVHAGVWPGWTLAQVQQYAAEAEIALQSDAFFKVMYGNEPNQWSETLTGNDRIRFIVNSMTRMRALYTDKTLEFHFKAMLKDLPADLTPWFDFNQAPDMPRIVFGHWSALGLLEKDRFWALDTGCVWGETLTMLNCDTQEVFQEPSCQPVSIE